MNSAIVSEFDKTQQHPSSVVRRNPRPEYRSRLKRKATELLSRQGDRPLRNQQQRLINRARGLGLLGVKDVTAA